MRVIKSNTIIILQLQRTILKMWNINHGEHSLGLDERSYLYFCHDKCLTEDKCKTKEI